MRGKISLFLAGYVFLTMVSGSFASLLELGPEQIIQAGGADIIVNGYSVPSYVDWNNDGRKDLIVGEGGGGFSEGKVRVYINVGTASEPSFSDFFYAQSNGSDLTVPSAGCLGAFARVVHWDDDGRKDLLVGQADGTIKIFLNTGSDENPTFDSGTVLQVGLGPSQQDLDVGYRATPVVVDWNNDRKDDLVVGALDGLIHIYLNCGCESSAPSFYYSEPAGQPAQEDGSELVVPSFRSSPVVDDFDGDGKKDILTGNTEGQLLLYRNVGTDSEPVFSGYVLLQSNGTIIDLPGTPRSRPFVADWTGDGYPDVLVGAVDGKVHLYQGIPEPAAISLFILCLPLLLRARRT